MKKIIIAILAFIVSSLLLEGFLRYYFYRWNTNQSVPFLIFNRVFPHSEDIRNFISPSPLDGVIFELSPNIRSTFLGKPFNTNDHGVLGVINYAYEKPKNTIRIVGIGDSIMSSWGNDLNDIYLTRLEKMLSPLSTNNVQVINLSVPGYNTAIEKNIIEEKALAYNPDLIILGYCGNDMELPNYIRKKIYANSYAVLILKYLTNVIIDMSTNRDDSANFLSPLDDSPGDPVQYQNEPYRFASEIGTVPKQYAYMVGLDNFKKNLADIAEIGKKTKVPILLIAYPELLQKVPELNSMGFYVIDMGSKISAYLDEHNMQVQNIQLSQSDFHLNSLGHKLYAEILYQYILDNDALNQIFVEHK